LNKKLKKILRFLCVCGIAYRRKLTKLSYGVSDLHSPAVGGEAGSLPMAKPYKTHQKRATLEAPFLVLFCGLRQGNYERKHRNRPKYFKKFYSTHFIKYKKRCLFSKTPEN